VVEITKKITEFADRFLEAAVKIRAAAQESLNKVICT
jgi:hypothetical protein